MSCPAGVAKKALRGDDSGTPLAKKGFSGDGGKGRFAKGPANPQVAEGLFWVEAIIHPAIVTVGALFVHASSLPRPILASASPNPSPRSRFLASRPRLGPKDAIIGHSWSKEANLARVRRASNSVGERPMTKNVNQSHMAHTRIAINPRSAYVK